ncbi:uncharacterized protein LOC143187806 [Calliopsis andreniformis]|uniref:uncharacterized protein LOC143187806 n=1 Tax=Calliopsis andreniformis TaxID=337506 RepID=UPI003FCE0AC3
MNGQDEILTEDAKQNRRSIKILQINLNRCNLAQDLLKQKVLEEKIDVVMISELYRPENNWLIDKSGKCAIWNTEINGLTVNDEDTINGDGYVGTKIKDTVMISVYISPNILIDNYISVIENIVKIRKEYRGRFVLAGDFNAKSAAWGSKTTNNRGNILLDANEEMQLVPVITEGGHTFERNNRVSKIDIMSCDSKTYREIIYSNVLNQDSASDHRYVLHIITCGKNLKRNKVLFRPWNVKTLNEEKFDEIMNTYLNSMVEIKDDNPAIPYECVGEYLRAVYVACDGSMKKKNISENRRKPNEWWNDKIKTLRAEMNKKRRLFQRARRKNRNDANELEKQYKETRKMLKYKIWDSKVECWKKTCDTLDDNIWGKPYKSIINKIKCKLPCPIIREEKARAIIRCLFPGNEDELKDLKQKKERLDEKMNDEENYIYFMDELATNDEVIREAKLLKKNKAPGLDGIPPSMVRWLAEKKEGVNIRKLINGCLIKGKIPNSWKMQRLVLIRKAGKTRTWMMHTVHYASLMPGPS